MTTSAKLFDLMFLAVRPDAAGAWPTDAEDRVDRPGVIPTQSDQYPRIKMRMLSENKQSQGRSGIGFTTNVTIRVTAEASAPVRVDDPRFSDIESACWRLKRQIEIAIINSYPLFSVIQQLAAVQTQLAFDVQATMLGGVQSDWTFEFYEEGEDFAAIAADDLAVLALTDPTHRVGFETDLA